MPAWTISHGRLTKTHSRSVTLLSVCFTHPPCDAQENNALRQARRLETLTPSKATKAEEGDEKKEGEEGKKEGEEEKKEPEAASAMEVDGEKKEGGDEESKPAQPKMTMRTEFCNLPTVTGLFAKTLYVQGLAQVHLCFDGLSQSEAGVCLVNALQLCANSFCSLFIVCASLLVPEHCERC